MHIFMYIFKMNVYILWYMIISKLGKKLYNPHSVEMKLFIGNISFKNRFFE